VFDLVIQNALIYDGSGKPAFHGCVAVRDGKIAAVTPDNPGSARQVVDAQGLALAPGFIDAHSHADYAVATNPHRLHVLRMGCTTEIAGQCGVTMSPALDTMPAAARAHFEKKTGPLYRDMQEQLATMITENVQRADLTAYEQAQAFGQLSMDFGMSAADISKQTGFSESTVRRRLKMAEMSPDALKKAFDKGKQITMADMERLAEIDDVKERETVLGYIGTHNFEYHLSYALREQKTAKAKAEWTEIMADLDIPRLPADQKYSGKWEKVGTFALAKKPDRDWIYGLRDDGKLVGGDTVRYIFDTYPDALLIYREKRLTKEEMAAEEESAVIVGDQLRKLKEQGLEIIFVSCSPEADAGPLRALANLEIGAGEDAAFILGGS
jgi:hypothetical protein